MNNKLILITFSIIILFGFYFINNNLLAQDPGGELDYQERDAIAVRVLPNPNNYSIETWYRKQGFTGSPQSLVVDGYQAIRDGRTVYVNAANVDKNNEKLYTNIYLISHNQDPDIKTVDILARIINTWQFNRNLLSDTGSCSIASKRCNNNDDCAGDLVCRTKHSVDSNANLRCRIPEHDEVKCLIDSHCPSGLYCDSLKAKVTRDVKRLGALTDLRESLENYKNINGNYPILASGTYIRHHSLSVWPSWQQLFLPQIASSNKIDPINILGSCCGDDSSCDPVTCWNEELSKFYTYDGGQLVLPLDSYSFLYSSNSNGSNFNLCAVLESVLEGFENAEGNLISQQCITEGTGFEGIVGLEAPSLHSYNLKGSVNQEFSGFIRVNNPSGHPLTWNLTASGGSGWSAAPVLQDTSSPNQKRVWAQTAGSAGTYPITINVEDSEGKSFTESLNIEITGSVPFIEMPNIEYFLNPNKPLKFTAKITDPNIPSLSSINSGLSGSSNYDLNLIGDTLFVNYQQTVTGNFPQDEVRVGTINATNNLGEDSFKNFNINIRVTRPIMDFVCPPETRLNKNYFCLLGPVKQGDFDITYQATSNLPSNIEIKQLTPEFLCGNEIEYNGYNYIPIYKNGLCWLDRNLGASRVCESADDSECFGYLFQWGRAYDGHQLRNSSTTATLSNSDNPGHSNFITTSNELFDWRSPQNPNLWQGETGINNPCPPGWRIPTRDEFAAERDSWTNTWLNSELKWSNSDHRDYNGQIINNSNNSYYWTSRGHSGTSSSVLTLHGTSASSNIQLRGRATGAAVRCVKDVNYWVLDGKAEELGEYQIKIKAFNNYNTENERNFNLKVNTFCGDGIKQNPNTEGRGGFYNDGNEDCDGNDGITNDPPSSSVTKQYGCNMGPDWEAGNPITPYPILTTNYCVFKAPLLGGGFCGDGFCQTRYENSSNCPQDCAPGAAVR